MNELEEIMNGNHKINHLHIEGDTIAFETELNNHTWNLTPRDIEIIIYILQNERDKYKKLLDKIKEYIKEEEYEEEGYGTLVIETKKLKELLEEIE